MAVLTQMFIVVGAIAVSLNAQNASKETVLMTVYEVETREKDNLTTVLQCTVKDPEAECQQILWTHEVNEATHEEERVESCGFYRVKTELVKFTSHLEILTVTGKQKGWYNCRAKCGGHFYTARCKVAEMLRGNSSFLCSEEMFPRTVTIITQNSNTFDTGEKKVFIIVAVLITIIVAIVLTGVLKWLAKRRMIQRRNMEVMEDIARNVSETEAAAAVRPPGIRNTEQQICPELPDPGPSRHSSGRSSSRSFNPDLFHRLPNGSEYLLLPLPPTLPSYETAMKEPSDTRAAGPTSWPEFFTLPIVCHVDDGSGTSTSCSSNASEPFTISRPPSYKSLDSVRQDDFRDEDANNEATSVVQFDCSDA